VSLCLGTTFDHLYYSSLFYGRRKRSRSLYAHQAVAVTAERQSIDPEWAEIWSSRVAKYASAPGSVVVTEYTLYHNHILRLSLVTGQSYAYVVTDFIRPGQT